MAQPTPRQVAIHESGHALCALLLGRGPIAYATIRPWQPGYVGLVRYRSQPGQWPPSRRDVESELMVALAGPLAESLGDGDSPDFESFDWDHPSDDAKHARKYALMLGGKQGRDAVLVEAARQTLHLLRINWPSVVAIADAMLADPTGHLSGDELKAIVDRVHLFGPLTAVVA